MDNNKRINTLIDNISKLTVLELVDLVAKLKEKFNIKDIQPMMQPVSMQEELKEEEKTEFDVILVSTGKRRIVVLKIIRELTGISLKEAKDAIDNVPNTIKEHISKAEAEAAKYKLIEAGATVELK